MFFLNLRKIWFFFLLLVILSDKAFDLLQDFLLIERLTFLLLLNDLYYLVEFGYFLFLVANLVAKLMFDD